MKLDSFINLYLKFLWVGTMEEKSTRVNYLMINKKQKI